MEMNMIGSELRSLEVSNRIYEMAESYVIPTYITFLVKSLRNLDVAGGTVSIDYTMIMRFGVSTLPPDIIEAVTT